tara:strand:- start:1157 stop:2065 length:909 start_codon:yes stop_codon:yes gene_type:complete
MTSTNIREITPSDQVADLVTQAGNKVYDTGKNLAAHQVNRALDYFVPGLNQMSNEQAKEALKLKAVKVNAVLQDLARDPEVQQLIMETGEAFGQLTSELIEAIEEPVVEIADRGLNMMGQIAENSGKTLTKTGVDLAMSILGEIPGVGGLVDLGVTGLVGFNGLAKNIMIASENVEKMATVANHLTGDALKPIQDSIKVFTDLRDRASDITANINRRFDSLNEMSELPGSSNHRINLDISKDGRQEPWKSLPPLPNPQVRSDPNLKILEDPEPDERQVRSMAPSPEPQQAISKEVEKMYPVK